MLFTGLPVPGQPGEDGATASGGISMEEIVSVGERLSLGWLDGAILAVLCVAMLRGLFIGLIRESFSIAAICAAVMTAIMGPEPHA